MSTLEWLGIAFWSLLVAATIVSLAWRVQITNEWLREHRQYIKDRDVRWEKWEENVENNQQKLIKLITDLQKQKDL